MNDMNLNKLSTEEKTGIVCLYFARLSSGDPRYKGKCHPALKLLARKYSVKYNTLKQNKDRFDPLFENGRVGYNQKPLDKQHKFLYSIFLKYKDLPIEEHAILVRKILEEAKSEGQKFFSIKTKDEKTVHSVLDKEKNVVFDGLNILKDNIEVNQLVFIVFGGDKPPWKTGLVGIGKITEGPHDEGYDSKNSKNFKLTVDIKLLLDRPIKREDLIPYRDTYGTIGIGPIVKWEPNQAISQVAEQNAVALIRAMLDLSPSIEPDLETIVEPELLERIKGATLIMIPKEIDYGEVIDDLKNDELIEQNVLNEKHVMDIKEDVFNDKYVMDIKEVLNGFTLEEHPIEVFRDFINAGKFIILTGPPGTGKTTLAERASEQATKNKFVSGYTTTTAISDWSTFDTIGGYMPDSDGALSFNEGIFLKSIRENKWIVVDEINRAEVDKAFGHFFTALAGKDVDLQYKENLSEKNAPNISIRQSNTLYSYYDPNVATYYIGKNWRIIGTMNTYDKNSLFSLSYAFMRRFALVPIPAPTAEEFKIIIRENVDDYNDYPNILMNIVNSSPKKLGAAIILDVIDYLKSSEYKNFADGICAMLIPQYEGLSLSQIRKVYKDFGTNMKDEDREILLNYLCEFFDIDYKELNKVRFEDTDDEEIEE